MSEISALNDSAVGAVECPATMCPLIALNGSPWTGEKGTPCPEKEGTERGVSCPWWIMCKDHGGLLGVDDALTHGAFVIGPNKPKRTYKTTPKTYECPKANVCSWQKHSPIGLCGPRQALKEGLDPRVCLF